MSQQSGGVKTRAFKAAFPKVLPRIVDYLGNVLPYAMTGLLVVYSLRNVNPLAGGHGTPKQSPSQ